MKRLVIAAPMGVIACIACAGGKPRVAPAQAPQLVVHPLAERHARAAHPKGASAPARMHAIGVVAHKSIGPFLARSTFGGLASWIQPKERGGGQELVVVPLGRDGAPFGDPRAVASVPQEATSLVVRPSGSAHGGWLVAWSALLDRGESLSVLAVAPDGATRANPFDVQRTSDHVEWADVVPAPRGGTCIWAEETPAGDANVLVDPIDSEGKPRGLPARVARGVLGWAAARDGDGVALALVYPADGGADAGTLSLLRLDGEGRPRAAPVSVASQPTVSGDVDLVQAGGRWLLAWTDRTGEDAQIMVASVDAAGRVAGPRRALEAVGGSRLVGLASGPAGAALAWTEPRGRARLTHAVHLASVAPDAPAVQSIVSLDLSTSSAPELVATDHGFGLLATARTCARDEGRACAGPVAPVFVRFDARLAPSQAEPMLVGDARDPAALGWNLRCVGDDCVALAADASTPTGIFTVDLEPRDSPFDAPQTPPLPADAPRVMGVVTVASGQPFTDLATARAGAATLVATLTSAVGEPPARHDRGRALGATIAVRPFDDDGEPLAPATTLTARALPVGGVAIAPAGKPADGAAVAWVAVDDGDAQVHVARVDRRGRRRNHMQLTTAKGDASDVALAWAGDGWIVAWVDGRDGNGEVYATKIDRDLQRTAREERITRAPGDAGDVALAVHGDTAWLVWSDPRESPVEGLADVYATTLSTRDARRSGDEVRLLATAEHSRSPDVVAVDGGAVVAWIEEGPAGLDAPGFAMAARLDARGHVAGIPQRLPLAGGGRPAAVALAADGDVVHAIVARSEHDEVTLDTVALRAADASGGSAWTLLDLDAPAAFEVALSATGNTVFFDDVGAAPAEHRVRQARIAWRR